MTCGVQPTVVSRAAGQDNSQVSVARKPPSYLGVERVALDGSNARTQFDATVMPSRDFWTGYDGPEAPHDQRQCRH